MTTNLKFPPLGGRLSSAKLPLGQPASSSTANPKRGSISDLHHSAGRCRVRADAVSRNASLRSRGRGFGRARSTVASRSCAGRAGRVSSGSLETVARERSARVPSDVRAQPPNEGPLCGYREGVTPQEKADGWQVVVDGQVWATTAEEYHAATIVTGAKQYRSNGSVLAAPVARSPRGLHPSSGLGASSCRWWSR